MLGEEYTKRNTGEQALSLQSEVIEKLGVRREAERRVCRLGCVSNHVDLVTAVTVELVSSDDI